ncbi:MAG: Rpn family recombination-promoting nuclease/putative transposase [Betaproteobacteria bacterium]|nr:Rpn family recombination-promoting nuclease/putative transposase [Betaproteobacteria bacterium]
MQFVDVKTDIAFKKVFGNEQHKEILIGLLNAVLDLQGDKQIKDVTLKNPWQAPDLPMLKETILDIKALDHRGITFIVEMQIKDNPCFDKRALYYTAKAYTTQINKGDDYPKLNQVIFIGILDFNSFDGEHYLTRHLILNKETLQQELRDFEFNFIELRKFNKQEAELESIVEKWIYFIKNAGNLTIIPKSAEAIPELKEAYTQATMNTWSQEELDVYEYWQIRDAADRYSTEEKVEKGRAEGKREGKIEVARNLKAAGLAAEVIMQSTGLSREEIEGLKA